MNKIRYFWGFNKLHQKWLNKMADSGYRLVKTGKLIYEFQECEPSKYVYYVDFVGQKSYKKLEEYELFLNDIGYNTFSKNINLNWNLGKISVRPYGEARGKIATSFGTYNKELLIVEKLNDGKPFELHTCTEDVYNLYRTRRNAALSLFLMILCFLGVIYFGQNNKDLNIILFLIPALIFLTPVVFFEYKIKKIKHEYIKNQL